MTTIEDLYKYHEVLDKAKDKASEHEEAYLAILNGTKAGSNEKRLASQFIARFSKHFPKLSNQTLDAMFDLCEDEDVNIRKQAVKDLPSVCKDDRDMLSKVSDVLVQLLQTDDPLELNLVQMSLLNIFKADAKGALGGLFAQILAGEELVRDRAIKFMAAKFKLMPPDIWTAEMESYLIEEIKKVLQDCTETEFVALMKILSGLKHMQTVQGRLQLIDMIAEQADVTKEFDPADQDNVDRFIQCFRQALQYFSKNVHSTRFVAYLLNHVIPVVSLMASETREGVDTQLDILKLLAELAPHCGTLPEAEKQVENLYKALIEYMPTPPPAAELPKEESAFPELNFSYVECLLYSFHQLARQCPDFLAAEENAARLKDFRDRLQYFARGVQVYIKQLRSMLQDKKGDDLKLEENKIRVLALKTTNNINILIKDLFHKPPSYKTPVVLSWKPIPKSVSESGGNVATGTKRALGSENGDVGGKKDRKEFKGPKGVYQPPTGKYSERAGTYPSPRGGSGAGGFRRGRRW